MTERRGRRRTPTQARSQARVERILEVARELLQEGGPEALRPTEVARRSEVPVGSVYQYFESRHGLLGALVEAYFTRVRALLKAHVSGGLDGLRVVAWAWFELHLQEPSYGPLVFAILGDPELQADNLADSLENAEILAAAVREAAPHAEPERVGRVMLLLNHLFVPALHLALSESTPEAARATYGVWVDLAERAVLDLVE